MGIDQFPSPFKVKPLIKKQKLETPAQSEIHTPSKSKVIENSRTITSIEHDNRQEDVLSWIDDLDSRIKRTLSRQYIESIELKNQTNMEDMREKYRQVPFDDSFRKLSSILKKGNEVDSDQEASYEVAEGKLPTDNEDDEMDFSEDVETNETPELESEGQLDDDIIEIISSEREEAFDSGNISNNYEENEQDEEVTPGLNINALRTQGVTYHIKNGRPRLLDNYMNINDSEQNEKSEYSSEYSNGNDDGIDIDETNGDEDEDEDEHENGNEVEYEGEYEEEHEERRNQDDSDDEIIILDSDEENNNTQINKEKNFDSGSNPASFSFYEDLENGIQDNLSNGVDHDDNEDEDEDEDENEHQEYVYPNNNLENNSSISLVYSNQVELLNENKVIDEKDNLMSLAEAVLKESNDMSDENSFMTARGSDSLYQDDKSGIAQYSTNINSGYTADYDSTDVNYQAANLSGIEEENKEVTDPVAHTHEPFLKEDSVSSDSIQLVDDFENISEGSLADEEQDYEDSSNNDRGFTLNKHKIYEHSGAYEIKEEESNEDNYSIEVEHINEVPIFKTVAEEDPETVLFKLKEAEQKFHIRLNSIKCLEDELILKNGHLPESYIPNQFVEEDQNDISSNKTYGKEVVADFGSIPKPIPKPLLQDLSILDETTILETMNDGDNKEGSISLPVLKQLDDGKTVIDETSIMDDNDNDLQKGFKPEYVSGPILGQIGLDQSDNTPVNDIEESKHEVFQGPNLNPIYYDTPEVKDSTYNVSHDVRQHDTDGDEIDHIRGPLLDQIDDNKSQTNDIIMSRMDEEKECIDVPALEEHDSDQSRIYNTTMNEMEVDMNENISNDVLEHTESSQSNSNDKILEQAEQHEKYINVLSLEQVEADQSRIDDTTMNDSVEENQESISTPALEQIEIDQSRIDDTTMNESVEENQESIPTPALEQIESDQSRIDDTTMNETVEENQESIPIPALEQVEADQSRIDDTTMNETLEENQESISTPALEQIEVDKSTINDTTVNETVEENQESISTPALEQIEVDQSRIDDTTMNDSVEENQESISTPALEKIEVDKSTINDTTVNETVEENQESIPTPALEQIEADQSTINDTTVNETVEENQESISTPALEQIEVDQSRIDDTTMNDSVEENQESIPTPALEQIESDQSRIDDITMNETVEENQESIPIPALEQVEADQSRIDDTTMNETLEENDRINVPKLKQIGVEQSGVADTTIIEMNIEQDDNVPNDLLSPDMEQVESHESIIDTPDEMADDNQGLLNSPKSEVIEQSNFGLATDEIQEMKDKLLPEVTESLREKSISEMLYPSITQELDDIHNGHDESKIDIETTIADNEVVNKDIDAKYESYTEKEKNALDQIPINIDKNDIDLNKDVEFDTSDEYENKRSLSSEQIVEEPQEADENIIFEYEQTTYVNVMGDGILHPSYIMEPIEEQQETQLPDYIEQLEIITGTSAIDDMEVLEPSAIIEPSDTETDRAELINSAFEQQFEIIEPTGVLEPPSRSQTPKLSGTHRESINAEEIFEKGSSKGSRKRNRESESFVRSKLRKLIYKPFQWLSKNRKSSPISPTHIEAPKLRPLDDNTANSSLNKNARKPIQKDADIKPDDSVDKNKKKYYELMRHLKRSVDLKSSEVEKNNLNNLVDYEKEEDNSDDHMIDDEDKLDYSAVNENEPSINAPTNVKEKTFEDENLEQSINESHAKNSSFATNSDYNPPFTELEINDSAKNLKSTKQRSTSTKSKRPRKVLGLDMSEAHIEPVRSLRSGHKYGPEENDHQTSDLLASPNKTLRSNKELPKLRINKRRHLSNTKALDNSSPIEIDSKQSLPSSRKSSGSKWVESLLDHPALRTRSKSPLKRSIYQISSDLEEDSNLPRRSSRLRHPNEKLNDDAALENENTEAEEEVKRGRPTKRH